MKELFVNRYVNSLDTFKECKKAVHKRSVGVILFYILGAITVLALTILFILNISSGYAERFSFIFYIIPVFIITLLINNVYGQDEKDNYDDIKKGRGKNCEINVSISDNIKVENLSTKRCAYYDFDQIKKIIESESLFVLRVKKQSIILRKDSFITSADFIDFIKKTFTCKVILLNNHKETKHELQ